MKQKKSCLSSFISLEFLSLHNARAGLEAALLVGRRKSFVCNFTTFCLFVILTGGTAQNAAAAAKVCRRRIWCERPVIKFTTYDASPVPCVGDSYRPERNSISSTMPVSSAKRISSEAKQLPVRRFQTKHSMYIHHCRRSFTWMASARLAVCTEGRAPALCTDREFV